jgi:SAM-dependent methyltransferase
MTLPYGGNAAGQRTGPGLPSENYWFRRHVAAYRWAGRLVRGTVVDAGAGEGYGAAYMARRARVTGMELDPTVVAHAAGRYTMVTFVRGDLCRLPLVEGSVNGIVALQVLEHLHCPGEFVDSSRRALRPGGRLVLSIPNALTFPPGNPSHVHEYDAEEIRGLLGSLFPEVRVLGIGHGPGLRLLDRVLGEPLQHRLIARPYEGQPAWLRAVLRTVTSRDFHLTDGTEECLDLFAVATVRWPG